MRWYRWVSRHPLAVLLPSLIIAIAAAVAALSLTLDTEPESLLEGDARTFATYKLVEAALEEQTVLLISMDCDDVFTPGNLRAMAEIGQRFLAEPGVQDIKSLTHSYIPYRDGFSLNYRPYLPDEWTPANLAESRAFSVSHPLVKNILVSEDGRHGIIAVTYDRETFSDPAVRNRLQQRIDAILAPFETPLRSFRSISVPQARAELESVARDDAVRFGFVAGVFLLLCVLGFFRSWRMLLFALLTMLAHAALLGGCMVISGIDLDVSMIALIPLLLAVQLTLLAHVSRSFALALEESRDAAAAVDLMVRRSWRSCLFAALTTALGLLSLLSADLQGARTFGIYGAAGVLMGLAVVFVPGVALLVVLYRGSGDGTARRRGSRKWMLRAVYGGFHKWALMLGLVSLLVLLPGLLRLETDIRVTRMLPQRSVTRKIAQDFEQIYKGRNFLQVTMDSGRRSGASSRSFLEYVVEVQEFADAMPDVTGTYSLASLMEMVNQVWNNWAEGSRVLPSQMMLSMFTRMLRMERFPFTQVLADSDWSACHLYVRTGDMPSGDYLRIVDSISEFAASRLPEGVELKIGEGLHTFLRADERIRNAQLRSGCIALLAVFGALLLLWRSWKLAGMAVLCIAAPILMTLGIAGYAGITMNAVTFTVTAIVAGVAVDDIVHLVTYWQQLSREGAPQAATQALRVKGGPIVFTSVLLVGFFAAFAATSFPPVVDFGLLAAIAFALSLATVLIVLPAWLRKSE